MTMRVRSGAGLVLVLDDHGVLCVDTLPAAVLFCGLCGDEQRQRHLRTTAPCWFKASWARLLILSALPDPVSYLCIKLVHAPRQVQNRKYVTRFIRLFLLSFRHD